MEETTLLMTQKDFCHNQTVVSFISIIFFSVAVVVTSLLSEKDAQLECESFYEGKLF